MKNEYKQILFTNNFFSNFAFSLSSELLFPLHEVVEQFEVNEFVKLRKVFWSLSTTFFGEKCFFSLRIPFLNTLVSLQKKDCFGLSVHRINTVDPFSAHKFE